MLININNVTINVPYDITKTAEQNAISVYNAIDAVKVAAGVSSITRVGTNITVVGTSGAVLDVSTKSDNTVSISNSDYTPASALYVVCKQVLPDTDYWISVDGTYFHHKSGATDSIDHMLNQLAGVINGVTGFAAAQYGNVLVITRTGADLDLSFDYYDSNNGEDFYVMKNAVRDVAHLPTQFPENIPIEIGSNTGYYMHYRRHRTESPTEQSFGKSIVNQIVINETAPAPDPAVEVHSYTSGTVSWTAREGEELGYWEECAWPNARDHFISDTMPHALVFNGNGSVTFKKLAWNKRGCGNEKSVELPSFVNKTIQDLFMYRNRLGFLTKDSLSFSKIGVFFDFWPDSAKQIIDTDPIDTNISGNNFSRLEYGVGVNDALLLFAKNQQFVVDSSGMNQPLTPTTVTIKPTTNFDFYSRCRPVVSGTQLYYSDDKDGRSRVYEYNIRAGLNQEIASSDITTHCPTYLQGSLFNMKVSPTFDMILAESAFNYNVVYVNKTVWGDDGRKVLNSWHSWRFNREVLHFDFVDNKVYFVMSDENGAYIEYLILNNYRDVGFNYSLHLDKRTKAVGSWNGSVTTFNTSIKYIVNSMPVYAYDSAGNVYGLVKVDDDTFTTTTNLDGVQVTIGEGYLAEYYFKPVFMYDKNGNSMPQTGLRLRTFSVDLANTGYIKMDVALSYGRDIKTKTYTSATAGNTLRTIVEGKAEDTTIRLSSASYLPFKVTGAVWEGIYSIRSQRM